MPKYICSSRDREVWLLPPEEVAKQIFDTEEEAVQWFQQQYPESKITYGDYHFTGQYTEKYLSDEQGSLGYITRES
ncbi:hypothetical protein CLI64_29765 (plasmid) [Nostoc sp. CENA543]|uniref:hypothetical protein n=1 Tax=Nostoc sp. CENA543 TaxID=1869241 RepID=UPI000CA1AC70|nr:hypothetical protein [Nostoc sp. CENA543]AUT04627.1 hypothetical protein CLI64_29765 [Nostoc sp. CENA543]